MNTKSIIFICLTLIMLSCNKDKENAQKFLQNAKNALAKNDFEQAKVELDSLNTKYPRAFDERKESITLLDSIRQVENAYYRDIFKAKNDSIDQIIVEKKTKFNYAKNEKYQDTGAFIPKSLTNSLNSNTLESGVYESGKMYLKSIYIGAQKHDMIKATIESQSIETLPIGMDGFVHRFSNLGKTYEVIYIQENYSNGIFTFLTDHVDKKILIELVGNKNFKYELNKINKVAISESYELSKLILFKDSIQTELQKLDYKDFYINHQRKTSVSGDENLDTSIKNDTLN